MSRKRVKQYLMLLTVVGLVAVAGGSGTFANFSAEVTNPNNTFAAGTLFLHNTHGATTCTSESNSLNVNPGTGVGGDSCFTLFSSVDLSGAGTSATLALNNAGTINASDIKFGVNGCTVGNNFDVTGTHTVFGSAPSCADLYITIQETGSSFTVPGSDVYCSYGTQTTPPDCDTPSSSFTLATTPTSGPLAALQTTDGVNATLASSATRYYVIRIVPNAGSGNNLQNRAVTFGLTWHLDQ